MGIVGYFLIFFLCFSVSYKQFPRVYPKKAITVPKLLLSLDWACDNFNLLALSLVLG